MGIEDLDPQWQSYLEFVPEEQKEEAVAKIEEIDKSYKAESEKLKPWEEFANKGFEPEQINFALGVVDAIEKDPQQVYDALAKHLGISKKDAQKIVEDDKKNKEGEQTEPWKQQYQSLEEKVNTLTQIALAEKKEKDDEKTIKQQEQELDKELSDLKAKKGEFDETDILMRMRAGNISAEEAYDQHVSYVKQIRERKAAPYVLGTGAPIPPGKVDVKKLDGKGTKDLVRQYLEHANAEA